jgi:hypothetical protein
VSGLFDPPARDHAAGVASALAGFLAKHPRGTAATPRPARGGKTPEGRILAAIKEALSLEPDLWLMRNTTGFANHEGRKVSYGLALGGSDFVGILRIPVPDMDSPVLGRWVALEVKTPEGRATERQLEFLRKVQRFGGFAAIVRDVREARAAIARARTGASA